MTANDVKKQNKEEKAAMSPRRKTVHSPISSPTKQEMAKEELQMENMQQMKKRNDLFLGISAFNKEDLKKKDDEIKEEDMMPTLSSSNSLSVSKSRMSLL